MTAPDTPQAPAQSSSRVPPRFVPTLTEVVQPGPNEVLEPGAPPSGVGTSFSSISSMAPALVVTEDQLVQRVMRRVQQGLDQRLREAVAQVVLEHTRSLGPAIAVEVESVVRSLVADALAEERGR